MHGRVSSVPARCVAPPVSAAAAATALPTPVYFVTRRHYAKWRDIDQLSAQDIDRNPQRFRSGVDVWIAQSYLRLRKPLGCRGYAPAFSDRFVADALCIAHRDDLNQLGSRPLRGYVLGVRADRPPMLVCDHEITQNNLMPDSPQRHYLPHWPQPGCCSRSGQAI